jgi:glucose/arabinose dehydrogenase
MKRGRVAVLAGVLVALAGAYVYLITQTEVLSFTEEEVWAEVQDPPTAWEVVDAFPGLKFRGPVDLKAAPGEPGRLYVVSQQGEISSFSTQGKPAVKVVLDLAPKIVSGGEMGLLGLAFHPKYAQNGLAYVNYTTQKGGPLRTVVSRFQRAAGSDPPKLDPASEQVLLVIEQPYSNHNGGSLAFGPDGLLYIGVGDGGSGGDPQNHAQDLTSLLGKILRLDVDAPSAVKPYSIPPSNAFSSVSLKARPQGDPLKRDDALGEIFAWGMRNPWRISFDPQGRLWVADVGQNAWEEIDLIGKEGGNFGWRLKEGLVCYNPKRDCVPDGLKVIDPVHVYDHGQGASITGGYVYRGKRWPALQGAYLYGDFALGRIWALRVDKGGKKTSNELLVPAGQLNVSAFGEDSDGELYLLDYGTGRVMGLSKR